MNVKMMKTIAIMRAATSSSNTEFLQEIDLPIPVATGHELLVEVKALSVTSSMFTTHDIIAQHQLWTRVAQLIDNDIIRTTMGEHSGAITAANLYKAHAQVEASRSFDRQNHSGRV